MAKKSSYQKLKDKNKSLKKEIRRLRDMIADDNKADMLIVKKQVHLERTVEKSDWLGDTSKKSKNFSGFLNAIK